MTSSSIVRTACVLGGLVLASSISPHAAKAQNRGSLQVTATVIESRPAFAALQAAKMVATNWLTDPAQAGKDDVSTVAQVSVRPNPESHHLVVTIDYSKN